MATGFVFLALLAWLWCWEILASRDCRARRRGHRPARLFKTLVYLGVILVLPVCMWCARAGGRGQCDVALRRGAGR
jgi:hypothetical protein